MQLAPLEDQLMSCVFELIREVHRLNHKLNKQYKYVDNVSPSIERARNLIRQIYTT